jgi:hypothetical protein
MSSQSSNFDSAVARFRATQLSRRRLFQGAAGAGALASGVGLRHDARAASTAIYVT